MKSTNNECDGREGERERVFGHYTCYLPEAVVTHGCDEESRMQGQSAGGHHLDREQSAVDTSLCPLCLKRVRLSILWQHININHISRGEFPSACFLQKHMRFVSSRPTCHWAYHKKIARAGCRYSLGRKKHCGGSLLLPADIVEFSSLSATASQPQPCSSPPVSPPSPTTAVLFHQQIKWNLEEWDYV